MLSIQALSAAVGFKDFGEGRRVTSLLCEDIKYVCEHIQDILAGYQEETYSS